MVIGTLASHSALQIMRGAKDEGFKTLLVCDRKRKKFYERFKLADEYIIVNEFREMLNEDIQQKLIDKGVVMVPHGSFVEYVRAKNLLEFKVPIYGNKGVLEWESDRKKEQKWFKRAGVRVPREFKDPRDIDRLAIVKYEGAKGGMGYVLVKSEKEFREKVKNFDREKMMIQEYIVGTRFYPHFFWSPLSDENELMGMDIRYEANADGLSRVPIDLPPTYVVTGNLPVVMRESLLPDVFDLADGVVRASQELFCPGLIGPYCLELVCTDKLELFLFEVSARIVAGTNVWIPGSPYTHLKHGKDISTGRRIAMEIKRAIEEHRLDQVIS